MFPHRSSLACIALCLVLCSTDLSFAAEPSSAMAASSDPAGIAVVTDILGEAQADYAGMGRTEQSVRLRFTSGPHAGSTFMTTNGVLNGREDMRIHVGDRFTIDFLTIPGEDDRYILRERYRLPSLGWLFLAFVILGIAFGGKRGATSLLGLLASVGILGWFVVPAILRGGDPLVVSLVGSYAIAFVSLYLAHGFNRRTSVALLSTCITLALTVLVAVFSASFAQLFGMGTEESAYLQFGQFGDVNLRGLLIGGFIIGALGVLDDITTAQTAVIDELRRANPGASSQALWISGMSVGREHIASLINTLALAYVGASLPLFLLFHETDGLPLWMVVNGESIAEEIVRALVGSTALLLAVPISTWCAVKFLGTPSGRASGHVHMH